MYNTSLKILLFFGLIGFGLALSGCKAGADYDAEEEITERILSEKEGLYVQSWQGARQFGTSDRDTVGGVSVDSSGDVFDIYVVGHTLGDFDGYSNEGAEDLFLVKYDFTGRKLWESQIGSSSSDIATGLVFNGTGGVYISGRTLGDLAENSNQGNDDIFLMQVSIAGEELWTRLLGSAGDDAAYDLFVTEGEDVYLTGYTTGDLGGVNSGSDSSADIFLAEYSSAGIKKWILQLGTAVDDVGRGIGTDDSQNIYVTGHTDGDLGGNTNAGSADIFLMKYNASQIGQWTHLLGTTASDKAYALCLDNQNNIYVSGVTGGDLDATGDETFAGGVDLFLMKYNPEGVRQWIRQLGTTGNDYAGGMDLDDSGNIYVTGHTDGSLSNTANAGNTDIFLAKFNPSGEVQWTRQFGTDGFDSSADVSIDSSDNIYVSGTTTGDLGGNGNLGYGDALLVKFDVSGEQY